MTLRPARFIWLDSPLLRVVDADTLEFHLSMTVDVGFGRRLTSDGPQRVRLARIDTWPAKSPRGAAGTERVRELLTGQLVTVETLKPYKYGGSQAAAEYMAEVTLPDGRNLTDLLVKEGHGLPYDGRTARPAVPDSDR